MMVAASRFHLKTQMVPRRDNGCCSEIPGGSGGDDTAKRKTKWLTLKH
ncbi:MAG: hypothetical protein HC767_09295 [Akkermansiaceae bacterium]|nr:hypothetical protein [Akkermansiaceae bacterium]